MRTAKAQAILLNLLVKAKRHKVHLHKLESNEPCRNADLDQKQDTRQQNINIGSENSKGPIVKK